MHWRGCERKAKPVRWRAGTVVYYKLLDSTT
jgi:hypothetical protein